MNNKKGTTIVEASIIFPLVIAAVIAVLYIVIGLYTSLSLQTSLHLALRKQCGEDMQNVYRLYEIRAFDTIKGSLNKRPALSAEETREYRIRGIFANRVSREESGSFYLVDDTKIVRLRSVIKE
jgi:hypothetical protein